MRYFLVFCCVLLCFWAVLVPGRAFLVLSETPLLSDVVVQFVGPNDIERHARAASLVTQGLAPLLMIPGISILLEANGRGDWARMPYEEMQGTFSCRSRAGLLSAKVVEDTHKEILLAKCAMDRLNLHSAILVSSPYHMRRIRLIADRVFDKATYRISCVAAGNREESRFWWPGKKDWWWLAMEYTKILWFFLYEPFVHETSTLADWNVHQWIKGAQGGCFQDSYSDLKMVSINKNSLSHTG